MINRPLTAIQSRSWLVANQQRRLVHQRSCDCHALLLPARQINRQRVHPVGQPDLLADQFSAPNRLLRATPAIINGTATFSTAFSAGSKLNC